jgi:formylglycine-generating enzyme required for sulfatase activity
MKRLSKTGMRLVFVGLLFSFQCTEKDLTGVKIVANSTPVIVAVTANPQQIGPGQTSALSVLATDDEQTELQYTWRATAGVFLQGTDRKYAMWQAPAALGRYDCQVSVSDGIAASGGNVTIDVIDVPVLQTSVFALDFSYNQSASTVTIENIGKAALNWQIVAGKPYVQVNPNKGILRSNEKCEISITLLRENLDAGEYTELVGIRSNGGDQDVALYFDVPITPRMLYVSAGEFTMGSSEGAADELPVHIVSLHEFWIDKYETTNAQYADFLNEIKPGVEIRSGSTNVKKDGQYLMYLLPIDRNGRNVGCPIVYSDGHFSVARREANTPARFVTWYGALTFARFYGKRLPTEAEWEKAARGAKAIIYPWGDAGPTRWNCNYDDRLGYLTRVGSYSPIGDSPYGCTDMAGNVWEWCSSIFEPYPYAQDDGREDSAMRGYRVLRGGAWDTPVMNLRCSARSFNEPEYKHPSFGFRCAK